MYVLNVVFFFGVGVIAAASQQLGKFLTCIRIQHKYPVLEFF